MGDVWSNIQNAATDVYDDLTGQPQNANQNGFLQQAWNLTTSADLAVIQGGFNKKQNERAMQAAKNLVLGPVPNQPDPITPSSTQPTLGSANNTAANQQLASLARAHSASSILTGGAGLMDQPTTASRVLVGS